MTIVAKAKITQGATVGDGESIVGVDNVDVVFENSDNTGVDQWKFVLIDAPPGCPLTPGTVLQDWSGTPTYVLQHANLSGLHGCWFIDVYVRNVTTQEERRSMILYKDQTGSGTGCIFAIHNTNGLQKIAHGAMGRHMNFGGDLRGWTTQLDALFDFAGGGGGGGSGTVTGASNVGGAQGNIFRDVTGGGTTINLRTILAGAGIQVSTSGDNVIITNIGTSALPGGNPGDIQLQLNASQFQGIPILPVSKGGTALTTSDLTGQAGKALTVNGGATGFNFTAIPAGASVPTGTGFRKIVNGVEQAAAKPVNLADSTERTGILTRDSGGTEVDFSNLTGLGNYVLTVKADASGFYLAPPAGGGGGGGGVPTGNGWFQVVGGAMTAAAQPINLAVNDSNYLTGTLPVSHGGTGVTSLGTPTQLLYNVGGVVGSTANLSYVIGGLFVNASGFASFGASPASTGAVRLSIGQGIFYLSSASNNCLLIGTDGSNNINIGQAGGTNFTRKIRIPNSTYFAGLTASGGETAILAINPDTAGTILFDPGLVGICIGIGGGTYPTTGIFRLPFIGTTPLLMVRDGSGNDFCAMASSPGSGELFFGTNSSYAQQWNTLRVYGAGGVYLGVQSTTYVAFTGSAALYAVPVGGVGQPFRFTKSTVNITSSPFAMPGNTAGVCPVVEFTGSLGDITMNVTGFNGAAGAVYFVINNSQMHLLLNSTLLVSPTEVKVVSFNGSGTIVGNYGN